MTRQIGRLGDELSKLADQTVEDKTGSVEGANCSERTCPLYGWHAALIQEIRSQHASGRPILVGTSSVEESELLAQLLRQSNIVCRVLNAKNDQAEAEVIADAGALAACSATIISSL